MLRVIRNHRRAAHGEPREAGTWELLDIPPVPVNHHILTSEDRSIDNSNDLSIRAMAAWDEALSLGEVSGYRIAQVTVIAPTGSIGLLMDCDTTGVEPDFALTKFKKLAGGGYFKIANQSLHPALIALGYNEDETAGSSTGSWAPLELDVPMPDAGRPPQHLPRLPRREGYSADDLAEVMGQLPSVFDRHTPSPHGACPNRSFRPAASPTSKPRADANFNGLRVLGLENKVIRELNTLICGTQTIEGTRSEGRAPPVFVCEHVRSGWKAIHRPIRPYPHVGCRPAVHIERHLQDHPPQQADEADIASAYHLSWELGLKANALYRDGCKLSQPLNSKSDDAMLDDEEDSTDLEAAREEVGESVAAAAVVMADESGEEVNFVERIVERIIERPMRRRLPDTRRSITHHFNVAGHEGYLTVGMYDDRTPGELFITMSKEGSTIGGLMDSLGTAISVALQYGVPVESLVTKFAHQRFEPQGMTTNREIPFAKSLVDYIFRWLGMEFIPGFREANVSKRPGTTRDRETTAASQPPGRKLRKSRGRCMLRDEWIDVEPSGRRVKDTPRGIEVQTGRATQDPPKGWMRHPSRQTEKIDLPSGVVSSVDNEASTEAKTAGRPPCLRAMPLV